MTFANISEEVGRPSFEIKYDDLLALSADDLKEELLKLAGDGSRDLTVSLKISAVPEGSFASDQRPDGEPLTGGLYIHSEMCIAPFWAVQEDWHLQFWSYDKLHAIGVGDYLEVIELKTNKVVWAGRIANWGDSHEHQTVRVGSAAPRNVDARKWRSFFTHGGDISHLGRLWKKQR